MKASDPQAAYRLRLLQAFLSKESAKDEQMRDCWLPALIGLAEAAAYPVVIGGWFAIKTAGQWGVWEKSRTAFNRFLLGNLFIVSVAYFLLSKYSTKV